MNQIKLTSNNKAEILCRKISADLPNYFGLADGNESYAQGVKTCTNFTAVVNGLEVGLLRLSFPYPENCNIYWMGILKEYQGQGLGRLLLQKAYSYAKQQQAKTMTVETLAPSEADKNYLDTYRFYERNGFQPLFDLTPKDYAWTMVYMAKSLNDPLHELIAVEKDARQFGFDWPNEEMIIEQAISECDEIKEAITQGESRQRIEEEIGDLLHTAISLCLFAGFEPEITLTKITEKFATRMQVLKEIAQLQGFTTLKGQSTALMISLWQAAKEKIKTMPDKD